VVAPPTRINSILSLLLPLLTLNPPPPPFLELVITPIFRPLFLLWQHLVQDKTADPLTRKELEEIINGWIRLMDVGVVEKEVWEVLRNGRGWVGKGVGMGDDGEVLFWDKVVGLEGGEEMGVAVFFGR
jgi:hypothetical protein